MSEGFTALVRGGFYFKTGPTQCDVVVESGVLTWLGTTEAEFQEGLDDLRKALAPLISESGAACREVQRWSGDTDIAGLNLDFAHEFEYIKDWIERRMPLLDDYFGVTSSIGNINFQDSTDNCYYNLMGQRLSEPTKGLVITKGKKLIVK